MTRQEFISKLALLDDLEFDNLVLIYKEGKPLKNLKVDAVTGAAKLIPEKPETFEEFFHMLPKEEQEAYTEGLYNWKRAFELAPWEDIVNHLLDSNEYHMRDFYFNEEGEGEFMKRRDYPHLYDYNAEDPNAPLGEIGWFLNSKDSDAISFREEYELDDSSDYPKYKRKKAKKHLEGGIMETPLEMSPEFPMEPSAPAAASQYDLSKLFNAINAVSGGDKDPTRRKYTDLNTFNLLYNNIIKPVYNYLRGKGWTKELVAGAMGNIMQESAFNLASRGGLTLFRGVHLSNYNDLNKKAKTTATWLNHLDYIDNWKNGKLFKNREKNYNYKSDKYAKADHSNARSSAAAFYNFWEAPGDADTTLGMRQNWADIFYRWFNNPVLFKRDGGSILYKLMGGNLNNQQPFGDWLLGINKDWFTSWDNIEYDNDPALESFLGTLQTKYELNPNSVLGLPKDYSNAFSANLIPFTEGTSYNSVTPELWQSVYNHYKKGYEDFYKDPQNKYKSYLDRETYNKEGGKLVTINKNGGSILDQLKKLLGDSEIIDLLLHFGIDELMLGGLKHTGNMSISIVIEEKLEDDGGHKTPKIKTVEIGDKSYEVEVVTTPEDMELGLGKRDSLPEGKGMLFDFGEVQEEVTFNMEECHFPLDIIFINDDNEVIRIACGCPDSLDLYTELNVRYVLEVNPKSGIKKGDEFDPDPEEETPTMKVLAPDGSTQMELQGGERIFSRKNTKTLIKMAKRAETSKSDSDYKSLGKKMFSYIHTQDTNKPEYVEVPED